MHPHSFKRVLLLMFVALAMGCDSSRQDDTTSNTSDSLLASNPSGSDIARSTASDAEMSHSVAPRATADHLAGTTWTGTYSCDDGSDPQGTLSFAASGNPSFQVATSSGLRNLELSATGQRFQYVPAGGGVETVVVEAIAIEPTHVAFTVSTSFERTRNGILDQGTTMLTTDAVLAAGVLEVAVKTQSQNTASRSDMMVQGGEAVMVCRATFTRQPSTP